jgi:glyoxylase-like metal-dependent hydrolase (beta-lactamase superfamily II)
MREIVRDVLTWARFSEPHGYDFNGYLVRLPGGNVCIDPVEPDEATLDEIAREGAARIVLTNRNHTRASAKVRDRTGARIAIHRADAAYARSQGVEPDDDVESGETIGPLVAVAAGGKSPGEIVLHWPERRILFVGDACVGKPPGSCALLPERVVDDPAALRRSLRRIADEIDFDVRLVGDGAPILSGGREALRALVGSFA